MERKEFPILYNPHQRKKSWPESIPWVVMEAYEGQARRNHSQSLKRLAAHGGLGPMEAYAVMKELPYHEAAKLVETDEKAMEIIMGWLKEWGL